MANVLDKGFVNLQSCMGGDRVVLEAARICYQTKSTGIAHDARLIRRLLTSTPRHNTVFEHAVFRFYIKCPLFVRDQWVRHRIGTFNIMSLRYCTADREYYVPNNTDYIGLYIGTMERAFDAYEELCDNGWSNERARGVLGTSVYTKMLWTVNGWSLMNFLEKRCDKHAQWEIRQYARAILGLAKTVMPVTFGIFQEIMGIELDPKEEICGVLPVTEKQ